MTAYQKPSLYREALTKWVVRKATSEITCGKKPESKDFHISQNPELFMAQKIHDEIVK